jgi:hypothetical protein
MKQALEQTVEIPDTVTNIAKRNLSLHVKLKNTGIFVPFKIKPQPSKDQINSSWSALLVALDTFDLSGYVGKNTSSSEPSSRRIIGTCTFNKGFLTFVEQYDLLKLGTFIKSPPNINR